VKECGIGVVVAFLCQGIETHNDSLCTRSDDGGLKDNQLVETGGAVVSADVKITIDLEVTRSSTVK